MLRYTLYPEAPPAAGCRPPSPRLTLQIPSLAPPAYPACASTSWIRLAPLPPIWPDSESSSRPSFSTHPLPSPPTPPILPPPWISRCPLTPSPIPLPQSPLIRSSWRRVHSALAHTGLDMRCLPTGTSQRALRRHYLRCRTQVLSATGTQRMTHSV